MRLLAMHSGSLYFPFTQLFPGSTLVRSLALPLQHSRKNSIPNTAWPSARAASAQRHKRLEIKRGSLAKPVANVYYRVNDTGWQTPRKYVFDVTSVGQQKYVFDVTSVGQRKYVFDVTSVGQRSSPWTCNSRTIEIRFHLECKLQVLAYISYIGTFRPSGF